MHSRVVLEQFVHFYTTSICNIFLAAKLSYAMQVLPCARSDIQVFHRIFARFIWDSGPEPMKRDYLFRRPLKSGGLRLKHLFLSQIVSRFSFLRDQGHPFFLIVIQAKLAASLPNFVISSHGQQSPRLVGWFALVADSFLFLGVSFSIRYLSTVSRKRLSADLGEAVFPAPIYRALFCKGPGQDILCRVKMCIPTRADILF